jgi:hypothetical protein
MTKPPVPLACTRLVCKYGPDALRLPHVAATLNDFLDGSVHRTLIQACRANLPYLVRRILERGEGEPFVDGVEPQTRRGYRQWLFTQALLTPVAKGNLALVQLLSRHFDDCCVWTSPLEEAIKFDQLEVLQWLVSYDPSIVWTGNEMIDAVRADHLEVAKWLYERDGTWYLSTFRPADEPERWAALAAGNGNLEMLQWIFGLSTDMNPWEALDEAIRNCHLEVAKWVMKQPRRSELDLVGTPGSSGPDADKTRRINLDGPVAAGCLEMVEWLIRYNVDECYVSGGDLEAARQGHFEIIRLLRTNHIEGCSDGVLSAAAEGGHLELVKWLCSQVGLVRGVTNNATDVAATNGHLDVVQWLHENTPERATTFAMDGAASNGHLDVIQWLPNNQEQGCTSSAMDQAAASGHLEVVKWLHEHQSEGCTARAMDQAASAGHLDVVQWLHANRREGCTTSAMDFAAANGNLSVVKWLHANRSEGCTTAAMDQAAGNNQLEVVQWLHDARSEGCTDEAAAGAGSRGHPEVFRFLVSHRLEGERGAALRHALDGAHFDILRLLYQDGGEREVVEALQNCSERQRCWELMEWSRTRGPTDFETEVLSTLFRN